MLGIKSSLTPVTATTPVPSAATSWRWQTGLATLKILTEQNIAGKVAEQGEWLKAQLNAMAKRFPVIGHVRGLGMMIGIEIVKPHEPADHMGSFPADGELSALLQKNASKPV